MDNFPSHLGCGIIGKRQFGINCHPYQEETCEPWSSILCDIIPPVFVAFFHEEDLVPITMGGILVQMLPIRQHSGLMGYALCSLWLICNKLLLDIKLQHEIGMFCICGMHRQIKALVMLLYLHLTHGNEQDKVGKSTTN